MSRRRVSTQLDLLTCDQIDSMSSNFQHMTEIVQIDVNTTKFLGNEYQQKIYQTFTLV